MSRCSQPAQAISWPASLALSFAVLLAVAGLLAISGGAMAAGLTMRGPHTLHRTAPQMLQHMPPPTHLKMTQRDTAAAPATFLHSIAVIGKDNRTTNLAPFTKAARSVGVLSFPDGRGCTAFCVGPDLVMSAAHCFYSPAKRRRKKKPRLLFSKFILLSSIPVHQRASSFLKGTSESEVQNNIIVSRRRYVNSIASFRRDWALARLSKPICPAPLELLSISTAKLNRAAKAGRMMMIGIHGDKLRKGLMLSPKCALRRSARFRARLGRKVGLGSATMLHTCDMTKGSSGAPIFLNTKDGLKVVAINVGVVGWTKWRKRRNRRRRTISSARENIGVLTGPLKGLVKKLREEKLLTTIDEVRKLQEQLNLAGLNAGPVDGKAGLRTKRAITKFEKRSGLPTTGIATGTLLSALLAINKR